MVRLWIAMLAAAAALAAGEARAAERPGRLEFEVLRNGERFGAQTVDVRAEGDALIVRNAANLSVRAGPITLFRYQQVCEERWEGGDLQGLACSTLRDGKTTRVEVERRRGRLVVAGAKGARVFEGDAAPTSWWTMRAMNAQTLIDTQTGDKLGAAVTRVGRETIEVAGRAVTATRYRVSGTVAADLWYDDAGRWVRCVFKARGQNVEYRLKSPLALAPS